MAAILDKATVEQIAGLYDADYDRKAKIFPSEYLDRSRLTKEELAQEGYRFLSPDHLTVGELQRILDWKFPRGKTRQYAKQNGSERVEPATRKAFLQANEGNTVQAVKELCQLDGVWVRMASAILTAFDPLRFTVLDVRAWNALEKLGLLKPFRLDSLGDQLDSPETYAAYLQACLQLADATQVSLRTLDRCLWTIDERALYPWVQHGVSFGPIVQQPAVSQAPAAY